MKVNPTPNWKPLTTLNRTIEWVMSLFLSLNVRQTDREFGSTTALCSSVQVERRSSSSGQHRDRKKVESHSSIEIERFGLNLKESETLRKEWHGDRSLTNWLCIEYISSVKKVMQTNVRHEILAMVEERKRSVKMKTRRPITITTESRS